jgi:hypothetical protein
MAFAELGGAVPVESAVVWNRVYRSPPATIRSAVGVRHGPLNADDAPNPTSSSSTIRTFGAPSGGRSRRIGGNVASGSMASYGVRRGTCRIGIGRWVRTASVEAIAVFIRGVAVTMMPSAPRQSGSCRHSRLTSYRQLIDSATERY